MAKTYNPPHAAVSPARRLDLIRAGAAVDLGEYRLVRAMVRDRPVVFAVRNVQDVIQAHHLKGQFYETEELAIISRHFPAGGTFVDIGANVGNHALFVGLFLSPARIVAIEPNSLAYENLMANVVLNGLEPIFNLDWLGYGVGAEAADGFGVTHWAHNLGGARLIAREGGTISLRPGDEMLDGITPDVIKIDVEGMELAVLTSLAATIARARPAIFVEVDEENTQAVADWIAANGYAVAERFRRYRTNENLLLLPQTT